MRDPILAANQYAGMHSAAVTAPITRQDSQIGVASFLEHGPGHATFTGH